MSPPESQCRNGLDKFSCSEISTFATFPGCSILEASYHAASKGSTFLIKNLDTSSFQALEFSDKDYSLVNMKTSPSAELQPSKYRSWAVHLCPALHKHRSRGKARHVPKHTHRHLPFCLLLTRNLALPADIFFFWKALIRIQLLQQGTKEHQYYEPHCTPPGEAKRVPMKRAWGTLPSTVLGASICQERCTTKESPC